MKIVEGDVVGVMPQGGRKHPEQPLVPVDTSNILFIGMGAFCGIEEIVERRLSKGNGVSIGFGRATEKADVHDKKTLLDNVTPEAWRSWDGPQFSATVSRSQKAARLQASR